MEGSDESTVQYDMSASDGDGNWILDAVGVCDVVYVK